MATIEILLPYPPSANRYWVPGRAGRGPVPSHEALEYKRKVRLLCHGHFPALAGDVSLSATFYRPRKSGDLGNRLKVLEDALIGLAYLDDSQICRYENVERTDSPSPDGGLKGVVLVRLAGDRFHSKAELEASELDRARLANKRRATRNRNRVIKAGKLNAMGVKMTEKYEQNIAYSPLGPASEEYRNNYDRIFSSECLEANYESAMAELRDGGANVDLLMACAVENIIQRPCQAFGCSRLAVPGTIWYCEHHLTDILTPPSDD